MTREHTFSHKISCTKLKKITFSILPMVLSQKAVLMNNKLAQSHLGTCSSLDNGFLMKWRGSIT